jgi:hypothetical protein
VISHDDYKALVEARHAAVIEAIDRMLASE